MSSTASISRTRGSKPRSPGSVASRYEGGSAPGNLQGHDGGEWVGYIALTVALGLAIRYAGL